MNFPGGYNCSCNEDFKVDPTNPKNCIRKYSFTFFFIIFFSNSEVKLKNKRAYYNQVTTKYFNRLHSNSDQRQISRSNINAFSVREVMRVKDMITQHDLRWKIKKFSPSLA